MLCEFIGGPYDGHSMDVDPTSAGMIYLEAMPMNDISIAKAIKQITETEEIPISYKGPHRKIRYSRDGGRMRFSGYE